MEGQWNAALPDRPLPERAGCLQCGQRRLDLPLPHPRLRAAGGISALFLGTRGPSLARSTGAGLCASPGARPRAPRGARRTGQRPRQGKAGGAAGAGRAAEATHLRPGRGRACTGRDQQRPRPGPPRPAPGAKPRGPARGAQLRATRLLAAPSCVQARPLAAPSCVPPGHSRLPAACRPATRGARPRPARPLAAPMAGKALSLLPSLLPPLLLAAAGLAGLLLLSVPTRDVREPLALKYGIVLDAGSSHTSMFIYKWPADKENDTGIVSQLSSCDVHGGGISSYADRPAGAGQSLVECLDRALQEVPQERHSGTPLYLGATAGMRLLHLRHPEASASVLRAVARVLAQYPFDFRGAHILSSQDEGVFGWVTANYLLENFIKCDWGGLWSRPRRKTLGALDLGGASTQITFETATPPEDPRTAVQLRLYGHHYHLYTHSFLCYGRDQVLQRLLAAAIQAHGSHPCWPRNYSTQVQLHSLYESPCLAALRPQTINSSGWVSVSGGSDPVLCQHLVSQLFNFSSCHFSRCSFNGTFQPPVAGSFIAFSAFFYTVDFLRTAMGLPVATLSQLEAAVQTLCSQSWEELQARASGPKGHLPHYCAMATFVLQLLSRGYGFDEGTFRGVTFQKKAGDTAVGWALGYMLNLTNLIPSESPVLRKGINVHSWVALLLLFAAAVLAAFVMLLCQARSAKSSSVI
ncbi:ectonucleoside triphosphate diphosphohydrolase 2 isoform X1 [Sorex araneus]|uniref:ectonucleoside triphosphate diphosphohydrolase 2 isoform X1 n=1 Tax=Sorex araneus TaxID=42254 RepID=UPI002433B906|nr:ectonucleoside triphosphate diphosphohydrolase 2 isoform X1 [Sorex araneus]